LFYEVLVFVLYKRILKKCVDRQDILRRSTIALLSSLFVVLWILPVCQHPGTNLIGFTPFSSLTGPCFV